jgi:hypothetical protein
MKTNAEFRQNANPIWQERALQGGQGSIVRGAQKKKGLPNLAMTGALQRHR